MNNNELAHVGVLGMKWGHRRSSGWSSNSTQAKQHVAVSGRKQVKKKGTPEPYVRPKDMAPRRLTDAQLKSRINRIEMEKKYALLTAPQISPARKMINDILANAIKTTATTYVTKMMGKGLENFTTQRSTPNPTPRPNPTSTPRSNPTSTPRSNPTPTPSSSSHQPSNYIRPNYQLLE